MMVPYIPGIALLSGTYIVPTRSQEIGDETGVAGPREGVDRALKKDLLPSKPSFGFTRVYRKSYLPIVHWDSELPGPPTYVKSWP